MSENRKPDHHTLNLTTSQSRSDFVHTKISCFHLVVDVTEELAYYDQTQTHELH